VRGSRSPCAGCVPIFLEKLGGTARENFPKLAIRSGSFAVTFVAPTKSPTLPLGLERGERTRCNFSSQHIAISLRSSNAIYSRLWFLECHARVLRGANGISLEGSERTGESFAPALVKSFVIKKEAAPTRSIDRRRVSSVMLLLQHGKNVLLDTSRLY